MVNSAKGTMPLNLGGNGVTAEKESRNASLVV